MPGNDITRSLVAGMCAMALAAAAAGAADAPPERFDGVWDTIVSCENTHGALGYSFEFLSTVKDSVLHGEKGKPGEPGWLKLDGKIAADGAADLYASGLVGAAPYAVGQRPAGSAYGYHIDARFSEASGSGRRVEGRPCTVSFTRKSDR
jgi:hypothetical protein